MGSPKNIVVKPSISQETRDAWKRWALAAQQNGTPTLVQLVHPGRQSMVGGGSRKFTEKTIAPSPIALNIGNGLLERLLRHLLFGSPREMTLQEIQEVIQQFADAAKLAYESGFAGIQIHGAHGYLLSQFLSPKSNVRTDAYGGTPAKRARIVTEVIRAVRAVVPSSFCVGIKLNSADVGGSESLEDNLEQIGLIVREEIDFIEISGGSYEKLRMAVGDNPDPRAARTAAREAFFLDYSRAVRARYPSTLLMVTGGFRTRKGMLSALETNACDLIGLGRPAAVWPKLPKEVLLNAELKDEEAKCELNMVRGNWFVRMLGVKMINLGVDTLYYVDQIHRLGMGKRTEAPPKA